MTTEEKAKAYDKAIEKIKYVMEHGVQPVLNKEDLQDIFPELAESEDERIKNVIRGWIYTRPASFFDNGISKEEILAWLEKQAPNPKRSEEDERGSDETIELLEYFINYAPEFRKPAIGRSIAWLKSLKQRIGV